MRTLERAREGGSVNESVNEQLCECERMNENGIACRHRTLDISMHIIHILFVLLFIYKEGRGKRARDIQQETHNAQQYKLR